MDGENFNTFKYIKHSFIYIWFIIKHKYLVLYYSIIMSNIWRGFLHDNSKFHLSEFLENVKYFNKKNSPILRCKYINGFSKAWIHHKNKNKHHLSYWIDYDFKKNKITPIQMPNKFIKELVADWLAAGKLYNKNFSIDDELKWINKNNDVIKNIAHPETYHKILIILNILKKTEFTKDMVEKRIIFKKLFKRDILNSK